MIGFLRGIMVGGVVAVAALVAMSQFAAPIGRERVGNSAAPATPEPPAAAEQPARPPAAVPQDVPRAVDPAAVPQDVPRADEPAAVPQDAPRAEQPAADPEPPSVQSDAPAASALGHSGVGQSGGGQSGGGQSGAAQPALASGPFAETPQPPPATAPVAPLLGLEGDTPATASSPPAEPPAHPPTTAPEAARAVAGTDTAGSVAPDTGPAPSAPVPAAPDVPQTALQSGSGLAPVEAPPPALPFAPPPNPDTGPEPAADQVPPVPDATPDAALRGAGLPAQTSTLVPTPGLGGQARGVITDRLPRVGDPGRDTPSTGPVTNSLTAMPIPADAIVPPLRRYARDFAGAAGKPLFAILLEDTGSTEVNRPEIAALPLPLSIVIDPLSEGAAERAAIWRDGGQEVVMAANGIPPGASASDLEQTFQALAAALPEAVAVMDPDGATFQDNRPLAAQVVPILAGQGRGLVTFDRGLNAADTVARRENLGAATIFRRIDPVGGDAVALRRNLDRAVFRASQEGRVAVIGTLHPDTLAALLEWSAAGGKSTGVTLAPVSALMVADEG